MISNITNAYKPVEEIHVRIAYVVHLGTKECLHLVQKKTKKIRNFLSAIRSCVKRRYNFEKTQIQMGLANILPALEVEARRSSTFHMIKNAHK